MSAHYRGITIAGMLLAWVAGAAAGGLPVLTRGEQVQKLSVREARKGYPVNITGVVTFINRVGDMFVQDQSAGVFVFSWDSHAAATVRTGDRIRLKGVTTPADYSPSITRAEIQFLGASNMPEPLRIPLDPLAAGKLDARWVEVGGVVRSGQIKSGLLNLSVASSAGTFLMIMENFPADWARTWTDARITVRGVLAAIFNERRQSIAFRVFVPDSRFVKIESPAPPDPFSLPIVSTLSVGAFHPTGDPDRRIHVQATLLAAELETEFFAADRNGVLKIEGDVSCASQPGDLLDIAGFPAAIERRPGLQDAVCRKIGRGEEGASISVTAAQVIPRQVRNDPTGYGISAGTKYDLKPVSIEGNLLQSAPGDDGETWSLEDRGQTFTALLPFRGASKAEIGGRFRLTGICVLTFDRFHRAQFFRVVVRRPADVLVVARPRWRSLKLAVWTVSALVLLFFLAMAWASVLKKQVGRQTRELKEANVALKRLSNLDPLTGTANRRVFDEVMSAEVIRMRRSGKPLSLLMIDIDFFKAVNDLLGHQKGDACLVRIAQALQSVVRRATDLICRYGGEEFAVILSGTSNEDAAALAEEIRLAVVQLGVPHPSSPFQVLTVSIGTASIPSGTDLDPETLVAAADRALYEAKRLGRNQVTWLEAVPCNS